MHKKTLLALLLALMLLLSSCSLVKKDPEVDAATEIVKVADKIYTKGEIQQMVQEYLAQEQSYYSQYYGYNIDITSESVVTAAQDDVINSLIRSAVVEQKAKELGLDTLSEEDQKSVDDLWQQYVDLTKSYMFSETELEGEELDKAIDEAVTSNFGVTKDSLVASQVSDNMREYIVKDVTVSDEEVSAEFDARVASAKTSYESNPSGYGTDYNGGSATIYYRPAGYRLVKQILIKFTDVDQKLLDELSTKISDTNNIISSTRSQLETPDMENLDDLIAQVNTEVSFGDPLEGAAAPEIIATTTDLLGEDVSADTKSLLKILVEAQKSLEMYQQLRDKTQAEAYEHIAADADDVLAQVASGADWDTLMAEKTQDRGMQSGKTSETGYAVCENMSGFDSAFVNAAMALEKIGDVSDKIASDMYGYYIIRYEGDVEEGAVELDSVKDLIHDDLLEQKQDAEYEATVTNWVNEANAVIDKKSLNN